MIAKPRPVAAVYDRRKQMNRPSPPAVTERRYNALYIISVVAVFLLGLARGDILLSHTELAGEKIEISSPFDAIPSWCFLPLDIRAENPGRSDTGWRIATSGYGESSARRTFGSGCAFQVKAGGISQGTVLLPSEKGNYGTVIIETIHQSGSKQVGRFHDVSRRANYEYSATLGTEAIMTRENFVLFHHQQAPADWRAYLGFANMVTTPDEWDAMPPAAHTAIKHWIHLGGHLYLSGEHPGKSLTELGFPKADSGEETGAISLGMVTPLVSVGDERLSKDARANWTNRALSGSAAMDWGSRDARTFGAATGNEWSGLMVLIVVVFAVLIGPLNVFVFAAARRRHRLFFTTPVISLGAGVLLVIAVMVSDGIGGKGVRYVWMENGPPGDNMSYVMQHQHSRCGVMWSTGFTIPEDAYFAPMDTDNLRMSGNLTTTLESGKVISEGPWFSSRKSQDLFLAAARPGRGRIEKSGTDERPMLTSTFDFPLDRVFWLAADGKTWWQAGVLPSGTATPMRPCAEADVRIAVEDATHNAPAEYANDLPKIMKRAGHFIAIANGINAIATHKSIRWQTHGFVTGPVVVGGGEK